MSILNGFSVKAISAIKVKSLEKALENFLSKSRVPI
jgi:hypothetical protein